MKKKYSNSLESEELQGPVRQLKQTTYDVVNRPGGYVAGLLSDRGVQNRLLDFSPDGMLTREAYFTVRGLGQQNTYTSTGHLATIVRYGKDGTPESVTEYTYNEADQCIQTLTDHPGRDREKVWLTKNEYDERGFLAKYSTTVDSRLHSRQIYRCDDAGNIVQQRMFDADDILDRRVESTYDAAGNVLTEKDYDKNDELTRDNVYHYDATGLFVGLTINGVYTDYTSKPEQPNEYQYDHHHNWTEAVDYEGGSPGCKPEHICFRCITYYGEPSGTQELSIADTIHDMAAMQNPIAPAPAGNHLDADQWRWIAEAGTPKVPFSVHRFFTAAHGMLPSRANLSSHEVDLFALRRHLIAHFGAAEVFSQSVWGYNDWSERHEYFVLTFPRNTYVLEATDVQHLGSRHYEFEKTPPATDAQLGDYVQFGHLNLYYPLGGSGSRDRDFERELEVLISLFRVHKKADVPQISMVTAAGASFTLKAYPVKDDFVIADLDLHYGNGFEKFNADLLEKFRSTTQGLILLHGEPGTGKTFYMRHLLRKMSESKKVVVYMPPAMVDHLADPVFLTFISARMNLFAAEGKSCIMLIEDAEPLLVSRDENIRIQGVTNLLNMTDGLLNDMLGLQIICTFNVPLKQLDKALLRPGRLIARKEFKALPEFEANVLAHSLGIKHVFTRPATLGEIYAKAADRKMLTHDA